MGDGTNYQTQIGIQAAKKGGMLPGLGQLSNGETFRVHVIIALFSFSLCFAFAHAGELCSQSSVPGSSLS